MIEDLRQLDPRVMLEVLRDPTSNLAAAALLMAIIVLTLLMVILAIGLFLTGSERNVRRHAPAEDDYGAPVRERMSPRRRVLTTVGAVAAFAALTALANTGLSADRTCARCHAADTEVTVAAADVSDLDPGPHDDVACRSCHAVPGPGGRGSLGVHSLQAYTSRILGGPAMSLSAPNSASCLSCHEDVEETVTGDRVRVAHDDFLEAGGYRCVDCHGAVGHGPQGKPSDRPRMALCLRCHDDIEVSAACDLCHVGDITGSRDVSIRSYPRLELGPVTTCRGCHSIDTCNDCHGLELPHPQRFLTGAGHGPVAAFDGKRLCENCHERPECATECHPSANHPEDAHPADWASLHAVMGRENGEQWCRSCHNREPEFGCDMCH